MEPGVTGRTRWFTERVGHKAEARSTVRLLNAVSKAERMTEAVDGEERLRDEALEMLAQANLSRESMTAPTLLATGTKMRRLKTASLRGQQRGLSALTDPIPVPAPDEDYTILAIPVPPEVTEYLDLDEIVVADVQNRKSPRMIRGFQYLPNEGVIVGRVDRSSLIQIYAWPKHPWLRLAYEALGRHWKYIALDPVLRDPTRLKRERIRLVDRIFQLTLNTQDFMDIEDPRVFTRRGLSLPPGYTGKDLELSLDRGTPPGLIGPEGSDMYERLLGNFLGELDVIDDTIVMPPLLRWQEYHRPICSEWRSIGPFPTEGFRGIGRITQLAIHPTNGNVLVAAAAGGGVWRTDNAGLTWRAQMESQPTLTMGAVAIAPSNPQVIYAASGEDADGFGPAWGGVGLYRSVDGGNHWTICTNLPCALFSAIVVHPSDPNIVYVAGQRGLFKSVDGGATWITNPGRMSLFDGQVTDVVMAHDDPNRLYIGVRFDGVYMTTSSGEQLGLTPAFTRLGPNQLPSGGAAGWIKLAIGRAGANGSNCVVAKMGNDGNHIFRTQNGGGTWTELAANVAGVSFDEWTSVIAVDPTDEDVMYAGNNNRLMRTTNGGATLADWFFVSIGVHSDQQDLVFDPNNSNRIFLANDGGVYRSEDRGDTWTLASGLLAITQLYDIDIAERDRDIVGGGAQDNGVYYRNAAGVWRHIPWGDGTQIAIDQTNPEIFYFSSQNGLPLWLRKSVDGGLTHQQIGQAGLSGGSPWVTIIKLDPTDPIPDPANNRTLFVCGRFELFRSTNGGQTWQRVNDAAGNAFQTFGTITALEFSPSDPSILYLGTNIGELYRGVNGGASAADWTRLDLVGTSADVLFPNGQIQSLTINPNDPDDVWVVFGGAGVDFTSRPELILNPLGISHLFRSRDGGANWEDASGQFSPTNLPDIPTSAVAISDFDSEVAYVGTDVGVFRTTDGGESWTAFQDGLPRSPVVELKFNRRHDRLFAGTMGRGVYVRDV
jgi:photosystem II stability/assembly factor-like uncharacterized protein